MLNNKIFHNKDIEKFVFLRRTKIAKLYFYFLLGIIFLYSLIVVFFLNDVSNEFPSINSSQGFNFKNFIDPKIMSVFLLRSSAFVVTSYIAYSLLIKAFQEIHKMQLNIFILGIWIVIFSLTALFTLSYIFWHNIENTFSLLYLLGLWFVLFTIVRLSFSIYNFIIWNKYNPELRKTHFYGIIKFSIILVFWIVITILLNIIFPGNGVINWLGLNDFDFYSLFLTKGELDGWKIFGLILLMFFISSLIISFFSILYQARINPPKIYRIYFSIYSINFMSLVIWHSVIVLPNFFNINTIQTGISLYSISYGCVLLGIVTLSIFLVSSGKQETKSDIYRSTILTFAILMIWILLLFGRIIFDIDGSYTKINFSIAGIATSIILILWMFSDINLTRMQVVFLYFSLTLINFSIFSLTLLVKFNLPTNTLKIVKDILGVDIDILFYLIAALPLGLALAFNTLKWNIITRKLSSYPKFERKINNV